MSDYLPRARAALKSKVKFHCGEQFVEVSKEALEHLVEEVAFRRGEEGPVKIDEARMKDLVDAWTEHSTEVQLATGSGKCASTLSVIHGIPEAVESRWSTRHGYQMERYLCPDGQYRFLNRALGDWEEFISEKRWEGEISNRG